MITFQANGSYDGGSQGIGGLSPDVPASAPGPRIVYSLHAGCRVECENIRASEPPLQTELADTSGLFDVNLRGIINHDLGLPRIGRDLSGDAHGLPVEHLLRGGGELRRSAGGMSTEKTVSGLGLSKLR